MSHTAPRARDIALWTDAIMPNVKVSLLQDACQNTDSQHVTAVTCAHLDKRVAVNPSAGALRGDMLGSRCQPGRIPDGIYTWWCHLEKQKQGNSIEPWWNLMHDGGNVIMQCYALPSVVFSCWFIIKVIEGKSIPAGIHPTQLVYHRTQSLTHPHLGAI